jgi:hypothetical protein
MLWQARLGIVCGRAALDPAAVAPTVYATLDGSPTNATLTNGNLTATHSNSTANSGARTASTKTTGKYYFEVTINLNGVTSGIEILKGSAAYATGGAFTSETVVLVGNGGGTPFGQVLANSGATGFALGAITGTVTLGVAVNFTNTLVWFRIAPSGNWNGNGTADPATNTNGATISGAIGGSSAAGPTVLFNGNSSETATFNFGASAFSGSAPSGYTSGWPS